ncbi:MAG: 23S ribosomal RNA methyltransferase Erm [Candidatus Shapirobacteria bacterium]
MVYHQKDSLSQNYIKYPQLVTELLDNSDINPNDTVVEIGPGKGIITKQLIKRAQNVIAIEKDISLSDDLVSLKNEPNLKIVYQDFLKFNLPLTPYKIFSNIPFSITSEILNKILKSSLLPESMYLIMQRETAQKFAGEDKETQSSILTKPWYEIEILGDIDRTNFTLKPQVVIVFVQFKKLVKPLIKDEDKKEFRDFVTYGFSQWEPTLEKAYKKVFSRKQIKIINKTLKISEVKPSELKFESWLKLFEIYKKLNLYSKIISG